MAPSLTELHLGQQTGQSRAPEELQDLIPGPCPSPGRLGDAPDRGRCIERGCAWRGWSVRRLYPPQLPPAAPALFLLCKEIYGVFNLFKRGVCSLMIY